MTDPKRLLEELEGLTEDERRALLAARGARPPRQASDLVWSGLMAKLPVPPSPAGGGGQPGGGSGLEGAGSVAGSSAAGSSAVGAAVPATGAALATKSLGLGVALGLAVAAAGYGVRVSKTSVPVAAVEASAFSSPSRPASPGRQGREEDQPGPRSHAEAETTKLEDPAGAASGWSTPVPLTSSAAGVSSATRELSGEDRARARSAERGGSPVSPHPPPASGLREESLLVASARARLASGDGPGALELLDQLNRQHPAGVLMQEREALSIQALAQVGQTSSAVARARAFLARHPQSPHADRVRSVLRQ